MEAIRKGPWKWHIKRSELYNLDTDIGEAQNVANDHPHVVAELRQRVGEIDSDLGTDGIGPQCRPLGRQPNPEPLISSDGRVRADVAAAAGARLE